MPLAPWLRTLLHCSRLCVHTLCMSGMRSWYKDLISMSSVRWRFWAKVGVSRVAFSPFITTGDKRIKVILLCNRITFRKQHDTFYKVCLMKASALRSSWAKSNHKSWQQKNTGVYSNKRSVYWNAMKLHLELFQILQYNLFLTEIGHSVGNPFSRMGFHSVLERGFQSVLIGFDIACIFW